MSGVSAAEKAAILSHYSAQAALASDAALYGPYLGHALDPRTPDDDRISEDEAEEAATDELVRTPYEVAFWLDKAVGHNPDPMPWCRETIWDVQHCSDVRRLLVLVMDGNGSQIINAAKRLRELYVAAHKAEIAERASEILKADRT